jgi:hypothetical protein
VLYIYSEDKNILEWFRIDPEGFKVPDGDAVVW